VLEIYNETIKDLLLSNRSSGFDQTRTENSVHGKQYTIRHDKNGNTHVLDLTIVDVCSADEISSLLHKAAQIRYYFVCTILGSCKCFLYGVKINIVGE
jgi:kinesin family protein C1